MVYLKKKRIYGLSTGRSGTVTLAEMLGGLHEPKPDIIKESISFYNGDRSVLPKLIGKVRTRMDLDAPAIVDHRQTTIVPIIKSVDKKSKFILLIREPIGCINSFYAREAYIESEAKKYPGRKKYAENRLTPIGGFPRDWTTYMRCSWYWLEMNRVALSSLSDSDFEIMFTSELPQDSKHNQSSDRQTKRIQNKLAKGLTKREEEFMQRKVLPFWEMVKAI